MLKPNNMERERYRKNVYSLKISHKQIFKLQKGFHNPLFVLEPGGYRWAFSF